jgi:hypothetical protein
MKLYRTYTDINGKKRVLEFLERVPFLVPSANRSDSIATRWIMEDGSIVMIPENVFELFNIKYEDRQT